MVELRNDITKQNLINKNSTKRTPVKNINIQLNNNTSRSQQQNAMSPAMQRFNQHQINKGINSNNKRVRMAESSASEKEPISSLPVQTQNPAIAVNNPILQRQDNLEQNFNHLNSAIQNIAHSVANLSRQNSPDPELYTSYQYGDEEIDENFNDDATDGYNDHNDDDMQDITDI